MGEMVDKFFFTYVCVPRHSIKGVDDFGFLLRTTNMVE